MMDEYSSTPRSGRTKKKSALSRLAQRKGGHSDDSDHTGSHASLRENHRTSQQVSGSRSRDDLADALHRSRLSSENNGYPLEARVEVSQHRGLEDDSDEGIGMGTKGYRQANSSLSSDNSHFHDNTSSSQHSSKHRKDLLKGEKRFREQNSNGEEDDADISHNRKHTSRCSVSEDSEEETPERISSKHKTLGRHIQPSLDDESMKSDSVDDSDDVDNGLSSPKPRLFSSQTIAGRSPRDLNDTVILQRELQEQYASALRADEDDDDDDEGEDVVGGSMHRRFGHPLPSAESPTHRLSVRQSTDSHATSSLFMSMTRNMTGGKTDDMMSQQSLQSTSVLPLISTKEARNRSFLVGSITSSGSFLGAEELKRFFPEKKMRIFVGTWNMCELKAVPSMDDFLLPETSDYMHDAYVIGTQESTPNREEWEITLQETLGPQMVLYHSAAFGVLYLNIFLRRDLVWYCSVCEEASVATRSGPTGIKTKGGVGVCFTLFGTSFLFVNAHLSPHDGKAKERIADYKKICAGLALPQTLPRANVQGSDDDVTARFDCVFWMGDLNFRLDKERERVDHKVKGIEAQEVPSFEDLMQHDELFKIRNEGLAFEQFQEGRIKFKPTYKFDIGTDHYDTKKMRIPSYTDRVLYRVRKKVSVSCIYYDAAHDVKVSDHRPVYGMFEVDLRPGRDNIPLSGGQFKRNVWLEANHRRATKLTTDKPANHKSSKVCSIQ